MDYNQNQTPPPYIEIGRSGSSFATQLNAVLKRVYVRMFIGLLITAFCALGFASSPALMMAYYTNPILMWGSMIAMVVMAFVIPARLTKMSTGTCLLLFCIFSALMGISLSSIFMLYTASSIASTFFITAGVFGVMSVYGYFTKSDLSKLGTYMMMALIGLIIAGVVNIFVASSMMDWIISLAGVLIFTGLTAYDTQRAKALAQANLEPAMADKIATVCAMSLYLDFINMFLYLLRFLGNDR